MKAIAIANAQKPSSNAHCAEDHTKRSAETVGSSTHPNMSSTFRMIQLNVRKQGEVQYMTA